MKDTIILSSNSPARLQLLIDAGFKVLKDPTHADEIVRTTDPVEACIDIAGQKMDAYLKKHPSPSFPVLTVDTLISFNDGFVGKQSNIVEAANILREFSGKTHQVHSGAVLYIPETGMRHTIHDYAEISFWDLDVKQIEDYLETGEWIGAAGAYRIQKTGISLVKCLVGDFYSVVGLPLMKIFGILRGQS